MLWSLFTVLFWHAPQSAPAVVNQGARHVDCSTIESAQGTIVVDRIAAVFFDLGSSKINTRGASVLDNYVSMFDADPPQLHCQVVVVGNADRTGPVRHNLRLSQRRANAVASYLRRKGLKAPIFVEANGEAHPLVDTRDGVTEAQNRYVAVYVRDPPRPASQRDED